MSRAPAFKLVDEAALLAANVRAPVTAATGLVARINLKASAAARFSHRQLVRAGSEPKLPAPPGGATVIGCEKKVEDRQVTGRRIKGGAAQVPLPAPLEPEPPRGEPEGRRAGEPVGRPAALARLPPP